MVYLAFHEESFPYMNYNIYQYGINEVWDTTEINEKTWPEMMFINTPASSKSATFAESMSIMTYMNFSEVEEWAGSFNTVAKYGNRGEAYEAFKHEKEQLVITHLEKRFPDIRKSIKSVYSSSPLTYKDYIGTKDGSLYGILKDSNNILASTINPRTRIPNVYLTGQNLIFHGILGATIGAFVTSFYFLDNISLIKKINNEN